MRKLTTILSLLLCLALCLSLGAFASGESSDASGEGSGDAYVASSEGSADYLYGYHGDGSELTVSGPVNLADGEMAIENAAIISVGGSAVTNMGDSDLVVRDSVIMAVDPAPSQPLTGNPGNLLIAGNIRSTLAMSQAHAYYINSTVLSSNWATLSTDAAVPVQAEGEEELSVYAYGTLARAIDGGYGTYADIFCNVYVYGSELRSAELAIISGTYGRIVVGTIADGEADATLAEYLSDADKAAQPDKDLGSLVIGGRNAIMIHSVSLPPYWAYEGYSQEELPLYSAPIYAANSTLQTDLDLGTGIAYDSQKQAYIDHTDGTVILVKSTNTDIVLDGCELLPDPRGTGALIQTVYNNDTMFMNAVPDGEQYPGVGILMTDMDVTGDILHEDYQRDMNLTLSGTSLTGVIIGYDCDHWNEAAAAEGFTDFAMDASYATPHGINLTLEDGASWTVTGESVLSSLTIGEGCTVSGSMTVDGVPAEAAPGTYSGTIIVAP